MAALAPLSWQSVMTSNKNGYPINDPFSTHPEGATFLW
jgi:hypothetical protein